MNGAMKKNEVCRRWKCTFRYLIACAVIVCYFLRMSDRLWVGNNTANVHSMVVHLLVSIRVDCIVWFSVPSTVTCVLVVLASNLIIPLIVRIGYRSDELLPVPAEWAFFKSA